MSKKSLLRRCPSRSALRVSMLAAWITSSKWELAGLIGVEVAGALELVERAADLGDHRVASDESDAAVAWDRSHTCRWRCWER